MPAKGWRKQFCPKGHDTFIVGRGKNGGCLQCSKEQHGKAHYEKHKKRIREHSLRYYHRNKLERAKYAKKYKAEHKEHIKSLEKIWRIKNKDKIKKRKRAYNKKHKLKIRRQVRKHSAQRLKTDLQFKLKSYLRSRLNASIRKDVKKGSAVRDLGCTIEFLKHYIEEQFYGKMSWSNWGIYWQLDHKKALMFFDLTDRKQFLKAVNYKNLQPLTIEDHRKKTSIELKERHRG